MTPQISVDQDVYTALQEQATPFVDTPNSVLRRLLKIEGTASSVKRSESAPRRKQRGRRTRIANGVLLPQQEYWKPILRALIDRGGSAPSSEVISLTGERLKSKLSQPDLDELPSGVSRWVNRAQFARVDMVKQGLLNSNTERGIWEITDAGRRYAGIEHEEAAD